MPFTASQLQVVRNIIAIADKYLSYTGVPRLAHLAVTYQESGWDPSAFNPSDPQGSFGPYQQNGAAWSPAPVVGPDPWGDYGFFRDSAGGRGGWKAAWASYGTGWEDPANRRGILQNFAPAAQGSIAWDAGIADRAYTAALEALELVS